MGQPKKTRKADEKEKKEWKGKGRMVNRRKMGFGEGKERDRG